MVFMEREGIFLDELDIMAKAMVNRKVVGSCIICNAGFIKNRKPIVKVAEYLLNVEDISTVLVYGIGEDAIYISARNKNEKLNLEGLMEKAFKDTGEVGGSERSAAVKIPLGMFSGVRDKEGLKKLAEKAVEERFLESI